MNNIININKINSVLKSSQCDSLDQVIRQAYTPSLWGNRLVSRTSYEGRIIEFIRWVPQFNNNKKCWKNIFREVFSKLEDLSSYSVEEQNKLLSLKYSYLKKTKSAASFSFQNSTYNSKSDLTNSVHWTKDPEQLKQLSLLRSSSCTRNLNIDTQILDALFGLNNQKIFGNPEFFDKFSVYILQMLENINSSDIVENRNQKKLTIQSLLNHANLTEEKLQTIIKQGHATSFSENNAELRKLSKETSDQIDELKAGEKSFVFGGTLERLPTLNIATEGNNEMLTAIDKFLNPDSAQALIKKLLSDLYLSIDQLNLNPQLPEEFVKKAKQLLKEGFISFALPGLKKSLITPDQSFGKKALLTVPDLIRSGTEKVLSFAESKILEDTAESFASVASKEFYLECINKALETNPTDFIKEKLNLHFESHLNQLRHTVLTSFTSLTENLPSICPEIINAFGYGDLGHPESPLWFEFERQKNNNYTLIIYAAGNDGIAQGVVPLRYENLTLNQLDDDFFLRLFSYRAWPKWDANIRFTLTDLHKGLLDSLKSNPLPPLEPLLSLSNDLQSTPGAWGLFRALISTHYQFKSKKEQDLFFYNWKKKALIDTWLLHQSDKTLQIDSNSIQKAAENLAEEALKLFDEETIDLNELKSIYATTWEILEGFKDESSNEKFQPEKTSIVPTEIVNRLRTFFDSMSGNSSDPSLVKKIIVDILGDKIEPVLDSVLKDLYLPKVPNDPIPTVSEIESNYSRFIRVGRRFTNIIMDITLGFNVQDLSAPSCLSYVKIAYSVTRIAYSILFTQVNVALKLSWAITYVAGIALAELAEAYLPKQVLQLKKHAEQFKKSLNEWRIRLIAYATARLILTDKQKDEFIALVSEWQTYVTNDGKISFDLPEFIPPTPEKISLRKIVPQAATICHGLVARTLPLIKPNLDISPENCLEFISESIARAEIMLPNVEVLEKRYKIVLETGIKNPNSSYYQGIVQKIEDAKLGKLNSARATMYINDQIKALPMPLAGNQIDCWSLVKNPQDHLEEITHLTLMLYTHSNSRITQELKNQVLVSLYKAYAIIDKLARRCPEAELDGLKVNPWALVSLKRNFYFNIIDTRVLEQLKQLFAYFEIDYHKEYDDHEIFAQGKKSLFFGNNSTSLNMSNDFLPDPSSLERMCGLKPGVYETLSPPETKYYTNLLNKPEIQQKLENIGLDSDAVFSEKFGMLYTDGKASSSASTINDTKKHQLLPRPFYLLRLANLLANEYTHTLLRNGISCEINDVDNFPASYADEDTGARIFLNTLTFGKFFQKDTNRIFNYLPGTGKHAIISLSGTSNAAYYPENLFPQKINSFINEKYQFRDPAVYTWTAPKNKIQRINDSTFLSIITDYLHSSSRNQNEIINETSEFNSLRPKGNFLTSFFAAPKEKRGNILEKLPENERGALELIWSDEKDLIIRTLAYFTQQLEHLDKQELFFIFEVILLRQDALERQLKMTPSFARTLGKFFKVALTHYGDKKDFDTQNNLIEIGIYALAKSLIYNPSVESYFPDFSKILIGYNEKRTPENKNTPGNIYFLLNLLQYFIDPYTASLETKRKACHNAIQALFFANSTFSTVDIVHKWIPTIAHTLNSEQNIRNEVLNALAWKIGLLPKSKNGIWSGRYPNFHCGNVVLKVDLTDGLDWAFDENIEGQINKFLSDIFGDIQTTLNPTNSGYVISTHQLSIEIQQTDQNKHLNLIFRKKHNKKIYRWVTSDHLQNEDSTKVTYWLEQNPSGNTRELLTLKNGEPVEVQIVNKLSKGTYSGIKVGTNNLNEEKVDLTKNAHGLGLLTWFQPLSTIHAVRSTVSPYGLKRFEFTELNIKFNIEEIEGRKRAVNMDCAPTFYIAEEQRPGNKIPALNNHSSYLLLENKQSQHRIILPKSNLLTSIASWLMKSGIGLSNSHLMNAGIQKMINVFTSIKNIIPDTTSSYYVYSLDNQGRLTSGDPAALLHLLLYLIAEGQWSDISHYLTLIEGNGKRNRFSPEILSLIKYIETAAILINDPTVIRIALRLTAIREENVLIQLESNKPEPENLPESFHAWFTMQVNFYRDFKKRDTLPHLPLDEYQELFILHAIAEKGKKLLLNNKKFDLKQNPEYKKILDIIGIEHLTETLFMPPEISQRYSFLKHKYASENEFKTNFSSLAQEVLQEKILNATGLNPNQMKISGTSENLTSSSPLPGMQESAIHQLLDYVSNKHNLHDLVDQDQYIETLCSVELKSDFCTKYRLAYNQVPKTILENTEEVIAFTNHAKEVQDFLRKSSICNTPGLFTKYLLLVTNPKLRSIFPNPDYIDALLIQIDAQTTIKANTHDGGEISNANQIIEKINEHFYEIFLHAYNKAFSFRISSEWEEIPLKFDELSSDNLRSHFFSYYQLALEKPPVAIYNDQKKCEAFLNRAKAFKKALLLAKGLTPEENKILDILRCAAEGSLLNRFPNPQNFEIDFNKYIKLGDDILAKRLKILNYITNDEIETKNNNHKNSLYNELFDLLRKRLYLKTIDLSLFLNNVQSAHSIASALPTIKDSVCTFAANQASSMLLMGAMSFVPTFWGVTIPKYLKIGSQIGVAAYKSYQAYDALSTKYQEIENRKIKAKADKLAFEKKNQTIEVPLPKEWLVQLDVDDFTLSKPLKGHLKSFFKAPNTAHKQIEKISPFDCPSNNPIVKKAFVDLNQSLEDFYARPQAQIIPEELNDLESYHELKFELQRSKKQLQKDLKTIKEKLLQPKAKSNGVVSDKSAIAACIKERSVKNQAPDFSKTDSKFNALIKAFIANDDSEIMRCALCEENHLPQIKFQLYRYLLKATRLQQINRALDIQMRINPTHLGDSRLPHEAILDLKIRLKQLTFELSRKRAYQFSDAIPTRLLRGYLAFEYGTGMMLWEKQVKQLQQMLLGNHSRSVLELIMGSGKTVFGTPMTNFFGSDGSQVIANFFPDALATENIKDLSSRSMTVFSQVANALKFSRETPLNEDQLWGLQRLLMRSLDQKESLNACKKDFQALQLLFIEEAHKAITNSNSINEKLLWAYMQVLGFIRKKVRANIDEAHRLLRYNDELNHPLGDKKKVKQGYINVISECMRLLVAIPEIRNKLDLEKNDQTLCSSENYHQTIKPLIAGKLAYYRPFAILPEQQQVFIDYLCGKLTEIPQFVLEHPHYSEIGLVVGVLNKFLPDALQKKVNVHFGTSGNKSGYAQPYSSKDTPIENSTFKNPYEAILKTLMAYLHEPLTYTQAGQLLFYIEEKAREKSVKEGKPFNEMRMARQFESWTKGKYKLNEIIQNKSKFDEAVKIIRKEYAPRMSYARLFCIPEIEYFAENMSCNSQNFASIFSSFYAATATPNPTEISPTGTKIIWDPGTAGEFVDHICRTCSVDDISELENKSPLQALIQILNAQFHVNSTKKALIDTGSLFYGLSNETVAEHILLHIEIVRPDIQAVVYFNSKDELMIQEVDKKAVPLSSSSIPPEKRLTYYDSSHTFGADIQQAIGSGGEVTLNEKTDLKDFAQGSWRMRGIKTAQQKISLAVGKAAKQVIKKDEKLNIRDVVTFTTKNKALNEEEGVFASAQQQIEDVIRTAVYDAMLNASDACKMLSIFRQFSSLYVTSSDIDPCHYGDPEVECDPLVALQDMREQQFKFVKNSLLFSKAEDEAIWNQLMQIGKGSTFPEKIKLYKKDGKLVSRKNDLGIAQHVSLQTSQNQSQDKETTKNQDVERNQNQEKEQNQDLQLDICSEVGSSNAAYLRKDPAAWNKETNYFASLDWLKVAQKSDQDHLSAKVYTVKSALSEARSKTMSSIANAFDETMLWTNNLQGILSADELAEPCSKKQMMELLVIQGPESSVTTCAIDQSEAHFWRERLEADRENSMPVGPVKIALFDIVLNKIVAEGRNTFDEKQLLKNKQYNFDIARWKFLAGHVNLQKKSVKKGKDNYSLMERFSKWLADNNIDHMKAAYSSIYKAYGFASLGNSHMQSLFSSDENDAVPELI